MNFKWICPDCGYRNNRDSLSEPKFCSNCGYDDSRYDLPEEDNNWGYE